MQRMPPLGSLLLLLVVPTLCIAQPQEQPKPADQEEKVEGTIWIYKATIDAKNKSLTGKIRFEEGAIYEVNDKRSPARRETEKEKRIGDLLTKPGDKKTQLVFHASDILKGRAIVEYNYNLHRYSGSFTDADKLRWKFDLRRSED